MKKAVLGFTIAFVYLLMVMGNIVTTTGSGLACPDWPLCHGTVVPPLKVAIWIEWGHRLLGGISGILMVLSTIVVFRQGTGAVRKLTATSLGLLFLGGLFGGAIVVLEAPLLQGLVHLFVISFHIVIATTIFVLLLLAFRTQRDTGDKCGYNIYTLLFVLVALQVLIGIYVRYGQASLACPDFPLCRGLIFPELVDFKVSIHFFHRLNALLIFLVTLYNLFQATKGTGSVLIAGITLFLVVSQATFGAYIVWTGMFLPLIVAHGANGFFLLGWLVYQCAPTLVAREASEPA